MSIVRHSYVLGLALLLESGRGSELITRKVTESAQVLRLLVLTVAVVVRCGLVVVFPVFRKQIGVLLVLAWLQARAVPVLIWLRRRIPIHFAFNVNVGS